MSDPKQLATDNRELTRIRRESRADATIEIPFNERTTVVCPECGESSTVKILTPDPETYSPSFGPCNNWDCDAFLKLSWDGTRPAREPSPENAGTQTGLSQFAGGRSA
ncbi:hypothetical protein [Haloferax sulfurifontis]|uniref:Uncharacterized protein n=2 Tax=Haloferax sulfurifontis TaxID=255616 RepID=M0IKQ2_9EURY|nr:hypothetical protein [Haloferax sulfurifontis]ELZ96612.1 hypothetical protein C441_04569 [Haloferax sulfurifontis ATCC BAA-897]GGC72485.1 hypothetical protein GCM10007209_38020 [Haloferax sulfurifontis]